MENQLISNLKSLGFTWETSDPFLFCVHHLDLYPTGNDQLGPSTSLDGRDLGQDLAKKAGVCIMAMLFQDFQVTPIADSKRLPLFWMDSLTILIRTALLAAMAWAMCNG